MVKWLTQEWLDEYKRLAEGQPERPGMSASTQYTVTNTPDGQDVTYHWVFEDGKLTHSALGEFPDAELKFTQTYEDAMKISKGELDPGAAFMQGKIKVDGPMPRVMAMLPMTNSAEYRQLQTEIRAVTDYG